MTVPIEETIIRVVRLQDRHKPLPIYSADGPLPADWLAIVHVADRTGREGHTHHSYLVRFLDERGEIHEQLQYETLEIAEDQAHAITGVSRTEWSECNISLDSTDLPTLGASQQSATRR